MLTEEEIQQKFKFIATTVGNHDMDIVDLVLKYIVDKLERKPVSREALMAEVKQLSHKLIEDLDLVSILIQGSL